MADTQQTLTSFIKPLKKYDHKNPKQILVTNAVVDFVAGDLMPLNIVESDRFEKLLASLDPQYHLPTRKHLSTKLLKAKFDAVKEKVMTKVQQASCINLTIDLWTNRQMRSFLGITAHFISNNWEMESVMLGCNRVMGRHTAENILAWFEEVIAEFHIQQKLKHIITDSGANVKKAFVTLPGYEKDDESGDDDVGDDSDFVSENLPIHELSFEHHACFAHMLQLIVKDGLKRAGSITSVLKRCSRLVAHVRKSTIAADILQNENKMQYDTVTRWNSQLKMVRSVLAISEDKLQELEEAPVLSAHDRNVLRDLVEILTPFEEATDFVQVDLCPSAGYVIPCVKGLAHHLHKISLKYKSPFVTSLAASFDKRMPYYEDTVVYKLAAVLDPRFKLRWCSDDTEKSHAIRLLSDATDAVISQTVAVNSSSTPANSQSPLPVAKKAKVNEKSLFNFMAETDRCPEDISSAKLDEYLNAPCVPLDTNPASFWLSNKSKFPILAEVAHEVLSVPSSSSPVERLFSIAGKVFTPARCRLTDARFQELMFIRCNN